MNNPWMVVQTKKWIFIWSQRLYFLLISCFFSVSFYVYSFGYRLFLFFVKAMSVIICIYCTCLNILQVLLPSSCVFERSLPFIGSEAWNKFSPAFYCLGFFCRPGCCQRKFVYYSVVNTGYVSFVRPSKEV